MADRQFTAAVHWESDDSAIRRTAQLLADIASGGGSSAAGGGGDGAAGAGVGGGAREQMVARQKAKKGSAEAVSQNEEEEKSVHDVLSATEELRERKAALRNEMARLILAGQRGSRAYHELEREMEELEFRTVRVTKQMSRQVVFIGAQLLPGVFAFKEVVGGAAVALMGLGAAFQVTMASGRGALAIFNLLAKATERIRQSGQTTRNLVAFEALTGGVPQARQRMQDSAKGILTLGESANVFADALGRMNFDRAEKLVTLLAQFYRLRRPPGTQTGEQFIRQAIQGISGGDELPSGLKNYVSTKGIPAGDKRTDKAISDLSLAIQRLGSASVDAGTQTEVYATLLRDQREELDDLLARDPQVRALVQVLGDYLLELIDMGVAWVKTLSSDGTGIIDTTFDLIDAMLVLSNVFLGGISLTTALMKSFTGLWAIIESLIGLIETAGAAAGKQVNLALIGKELMDNERESKKAQKSRDVNYEVFLIRERRKILARREKEEASPVRGVTEGFSQALKDAFALVGGLDQAVNVAGGIIGGIRSDLPGLRQRAKSLAATLGPITGSGSGAGPLDTTTEGKFKKDRELEQLLTLQREIALRMGDIAEAERKTQELYQFRLDTLEAQGKLDEDARKLLAMQRDEDLREVRERAKFLRELAQQQRENRQQFREGRLSRALALQRDTPGYVAPTDLAGQRAQAAQRGAIDQQLGQIALDQASRAVNAAGGAYIRALFGDTTPEQKAAAEKALADAMTKRMEAEDALARSAYETAEALGAINRAAMEALRDDALRAAEVARGRAAIGRRDTPAGRLADARDAVLRAGNELAAGQGRFEEGLITQTQLDELQLKVDQTKDELAQLANDLFQSVGEVLQEALRGLVDDLAGAIVGGDNIGDVFKKAGKDFAKKVLAQQLQSGLFGTADEKGMMQGGLFSGLMNSLGGSKGGEAGAAGGFDPTMMLLGLGVGLLGGLLGGKKKKRPSGADFAVDVLKLPEQLRLGRNLLPSTLFERAGFGQAALAGGPSAVYDFRGAMFISPDDERVVRWLNGLSSRSALEALSFDDWKVPS